MDPKLTKNKWADAAVFEQFSPREHGIKRFTSLHLIGRIDQIVTSTEEVFRSTPIYIYIYHGPLPLCSQNALTTIFRAGSDTGSNPMDYILPAYETLWRVVLFGFIEVNFRNGQFSTEAIQWMDEFKL